MAFAVASKVAAPKPVFLMDILASSSASGKTVASACHLIVTSGGAPLRSSDDGTDRRRESDPSIPKLFTGGADVLDLLDEAAMRDPLLAPAEDGGARAASMTGLFPRGQWVFKEDGDAVQLEVAMPGLGNEHVKMRADKDALVIEGDGGDDKVPAGYIYRVGLSSQAFKMDQIKAEMDNGVLSVTVPKIKDEERRDVFEIKMESRGWASAGSTRFSWSHSIS